MLRVKMPETTVEVDMLKYSTQCCPFCNCVKDVRYQTFNMETGQLSSNTMSVDAFQHGILNNKEFLELNKPIEVFCPQCYVSFSIYKSLAVF